MPLHCALPVCALTMAGSVFSSIPLRRVGGYEGDTGRIVAFLLSDSTGYLTGATIALDGGQADSG